MYRTTSFIQLLWIQLFILIKNKHHYDFLIQLRNSFIDLFVTVSLSVNLLLLPLKVVKLKPLYECMEAQTKAYFQKLIERINDFKKNLYFSMFLCRITFQVMTSDVSSKVFDTSYNIYKIIAWAHLTITSCPGRVIIQN